MQYRTLGRTGLEISEIGFGAWGIGGGWGKQDDSEALATLEAAFDRGINFYDSAYAYGDGHSEVLLGQAFANKRDKVILTSKIPPKTFSWPTKDEPVTETFPKEWIIECVERSLKKFNTDYIDLMQLHAWSDQYNEQLDWLEALTTLKEQGKIRYFGVSANDWNPYNTVRLIESGNCDTVQVIYNIFEQRPAEKLLPAAQKHNVGIIARVPFEEGLLTGKFRQGHQFDEGDWRAEWMTPERLTAVEPRIQALEAELDETTDSLAALSLKFILSHPAISSVIPGMRKLANMDANCAVSDSAQLKDEKVEALKGHAFVHGWDYPWAAK